MLPDTARFAAVCVVACALSFAYRDASKRAIPNEKQLVTQTLENIETGCLHWGRQKLKMRSEDPGACGVVPHESHDVAARD
jgi:hypothetical protein